MKNWQPKCKFCGERFLPLNNNSLQKFCLKTDECIKAFSVYANSDKEKKKAWNKEKKEVKTKLKTLSDYEKEAKTVFQKWVRLRDTKEGCISCGKESNRYDGGHYFDAGQYSGLIFHEWNVNKQCSMYCNNMMHGNKANYRIGLVKKIGEESVKWLEENKDRLRNYKYTKDELISIKKQYQQKIKEL